MVRENIRFQEGNFTGDDTYFYSMLDGSQALQQKVDDGTVAFTFPLDTSVAGNIKELEWDGVNFWSLEDKSGGTGVVIRRWGIESFICKQQQIFQLDDGATHTYNSSAFALEHYRLTVGTNINGGKYTQGLTDIELSDNSMLEPGDVLTFVRRFTSPAQRVGTAFVEQATVQNTVSGSNTMVRLTASMQGDPHGDDKGFRGPEIDIDGLGGTHPPTPDEVFVTKYIWLANDDSPGAPGTPSLYKIRASNGSNVVQFSGTQYNGIGGLAFYAKMNYLTGLDDANLTPYRTTVEVDSDQGGRQTYLLVARGSTLLFFNTDSYVIDRSLVMNNIKVDTINIWPVYDMWIGGVEPDVVLYRLQLGTTYKNQSLVLTDASWSQYNYEKQFLRRIVNSIAVTADPSIIPADGNTTSQISAVLRDQYNDLISSGKMVNWADESGEQRLSATQAPTDEFGTSRVNYTAGVVEADVKITASVVNGLLD